MSTAFAAAPRELDRAHIGDQIFDDLKREIITGKLPRGAKLPTVRKLSELYGVSGPTVREALRGLSVSGLVDVRHGSGVYVSANGETLVAKSLSAVIQLETIGIADALDILSVLNVHAASCAVRQATAADLRRLREASDALEHVATSKEAAARVRAFHHVLVKAAHHPLLEVICAFLSDVQVEFAVAITGDDVAIWRDILGNLQPVRTRFVEAIERRDAKAAPLLAREFHAEAVRLVTSLPKAQQVRIDDPKLGGLLSSIVSAMTDGG